MHAPRGNKASAAREATAKRRLKVHPDAGRAARAGFFLLKALVAVLCLCIAACNQSSPSTPNGPVRIVSLSPSITEMLFAIGADESVVGVSDYCGYPPEARRRTRTGSALTPNYEAIARLRPTLMLTERIQDPRTEQLSAIAPTQVLPWLTLAEVVASTRKIGQLTGREALADPLADKLEQRLSRAPPVDAPRVLLVLGSNPGKLSDVWFVQRNSIHGAALAAAGARNAVDEDIHGAPNLSLERVIALNPDAVIILAVAEQLDPATEATYIADFTSLPLDAGKRGMVQVLHGSAVRSTGPRILDFVEMLAPVVSKIARHSQ
jgi:ABC-type Fe3+-hydroxamate transport system substrate-binding protein